VKEGGEERTPVRPMTVGGSSSSGEGNKTVGEKEKGEKHEGTVATHIEIE